MKFSDQAIEMALTLRTAFSLPLRQGKGFLRSVLSLMNVDFEAPDHTTLSRRSLNLNVDLHRDADNMPIHLIVDSTGLSIVGDGMWTAAKCRGRGESARKKLHIRVDQTALIVAKALTHGSALEEHLEIRTVRPSGIRLQYLVSNRTLSRKNIEGPGVEWTDNGFVFDFAVAETTSGVWTRIVYGIEARPDAAD